MTMAARIDTEGAVPAGLGALWRRHLIGLAVVTAAMLALFARDAADMVGIWWNSSTFNHCLLIPAIIGWLVAQRWPQLRLITPRAWSPGLVIIAGGAFAWLLGDAAGVALARHLGLIVMLQGVVIACLGLAVSRGLAFPLFYALFLVPAGEELVPPLQTVTARMSMLLLHLFDVPAHIEGVFITIPNGYFEVAEACSGVKFLIAMIAYGALASYVCFHSRVRRTLFMAVAVIVPIIANGLRAWGTIYVSHLTDSHFGGDFDHVFYGWIFFGIVIAVVMGAGWRFFDRDAGEDWIDPRAIEPVPPAPRPRAALLRTCIASMLIAVAPLAWGAAIAAAGRSALPAVVALPDLPGWRKAAPAGYPWRPRFAGADRLLMQSYADARGQRIDLAVAIYTDQAEGREIVGYGQGAIDPGSAWAWTDERVAPTAGRASRITAPGPVVREVATFYRVGGVTTGSEMRVKLETLKVHLLGGSRRAVAVLVSAEQPDRATSARDRIDAFLGALGPVDQLADTLSGAD